MSEEPEHDEKRLAALRRIRGRFVDRADGGDEAAAGILRAIDAMIADTEGRRSRRR